MGDVTYGTQLGEMALQSVGPGLRFIIHALVFAWYVYTLNINCSAEITVKHPGALQYGGRWKYLTFINLVLQTVFFGLCCLADVTSQLCPSTNKASPACLSKICDTVFTVFAFPIGMFVVLSFWSIYAFDRELVYPKYLDDIIPGWLNHAMHTVVMPLLIVEQYLQPHQYPKRIKSLIGLALFFVTYLAWVLWVRHASGIWVYPIMARLSPVGWVLFLVAAALAISPLYLLGEKLCQVFWGKTERKTKKKE